ncbi:unnamed protein product [Prunus armeniaca]
MSEHHPTLKRSKTVRDFKKRNNEESTSMGSNPPLLPPICEKQPHSESQRVEYESLRAESQRANFDQEVNTNFLERDPGLRPQIDTFLPNQRVGINTDKQIKPTEPNQTKKECFLTKPKKSTADPNVTEGQWFGL